MDTKALQLLQLLYEQTMKAYWYDHKHCGADFDNTGCIPCAHYNFCQDHEQVMRLLKEAQ